MVGFEGGNTQQLVITASAYTTGETNAWKAYTGGMPMGSRAAFRAYFRGLGARSTEIANTNSYWETPTAYSGCPLWVKP